ncbi:hypothetical protein EMIT0P44_50094 [Pseudomonas sp. IT-P44]
MRQRDNPLPVYYLGECPVGAVSVQSLSWLTSKGNQNRGMLAVRTQVRSRGQNARVWS